MLDLARDQQVRSLLYLSTSEIYGDPDAAHIPTPEDYRGYVSCTGPRACYDESKRLAETLCATYYSLYQLPIKVVRPFNVYGPGQRLDDRRIVPDLISAAIERKSLVLLSDGTATRAFCYISDFITALWFILMSDANGEAFNVGNDEGETLIRQLADLVKQCAGDAQAQYPVCAERRPELSDGQSAAPLPGPDQVAVALSLEAEGERGRRIEANVAVVPRSRWIQCVRACSVTEP